MPVYTEDKALTDEVKRIITQNHPKLTQLRIRPMFREEAAVSNGKLVAGMCVRVDDRNYSIHNADFIIEIARDVWDQAEPKFREAIVDHELMHIGIHCDENGVSKRDPKTNRVKVYIRHHDVEDFEEIISRHGAYRQDLMAFFDAFVKNKAKQAKAQQEKDEEKESEEAASVVAELD